MSRSSTTLTTGTTTSTTTATLPTNDNRWRQVTISADHVNGGNVLVEESSFMVRFPRHREEYLKQTWPLISDTLLKYNIACDLDLIDGSMSVKTTRKTIDPYAIINARDLIRLLSRSVPLHQASRIFNDDVYCDIIKISHPNKERFVKRRQRLVGPNGATLKAIEILSGCYVLVEGKTVAALGPLSGIKIVRKIAEDCMNNIHPIYNIKPLMIRRELAKDPLLKNEDWSRFLPTYKKNAAKKKKKVAVAEVKAGAGASAATITTTTTTTTAAAAAAAAASATMNSSSLPTQIDKKKKRKQDDVNKNEKVYSPFPNPPMPRKIDLMLESGEYFMSEEERRRDAKRRKREKDLQRNANAHAAKLAQKKKRSMAPPPNEAIRGSWTLIEKQESNAKNVSVPSVAASSSSSAASSQLRSLSAIIKSKKKVKTQAKKGAGAGEEGE